MARCQRSKLLSPRQEEWIGCYDKHIGVLVRDRCERLINFGHCASVVVGLQLPPLVRLEPRFLYLEMSDSQAY